MVRLLNGILFLIPGWFEVLPEDGRPVEYFDTIYGITSVKPRQFLVRTSTVGYQLTVDENGSSWTPCEVRPGEVLTTGIVYNDQKKHKASTNMKNLFKRILRQGRFGKKDNDLRYLQCFNSEGKEIMIPLIMSGVFSPVGDTTETNYDAVYDLQDMLLAFSLPVKVQLVHGNPKQKQVVPNGVLRIEGARDQDYAMVKLGYPKYASEDLFELPVDCDLLFLKEEILKPKKLASTPDKVEEQESSTRVEESVVKDISLPVRVPSKDNRKLKGSVILEKLSARKSKKQRASLKALQEEGVFSSRLNKQEMTYDDFFCKTDGDDDSDEESSNQKKEDKIEDKKVEEETVSEHSDTKNQGPEAGYAVVRKRERNGQKPERPKSIQERTLPPIPVEEPGDEPSAEIKPSLPKTAPPARATVTPRSQLNSDLDDSSETLYEKLPPAPNPPISVNQSDTAASRRSNNAARTTCEEDGYLIPTEAKNQHVRSPSTVHSPEEFYVPKRLPRANSREGHRALRAQRSRSEYGVLNPDCPLDIDDLFDFSAAERGGMYAEYSGTPDNRTLTRTLTPNMARAGSRELPGLTGMRLKSMSQRNLSMDPNATIRSHNVKKLRTALELFNFSDSFMDLRDERAAQHADGLLQGVQLAREPSRFIYGPRREEDDILASQQAPRRNFTGRDSGIGGISYAESEPGYRQYQRSYSVTGLSDSYIKNGDDSAISLCSRGDYGGYNAESEYSYTGYHDPRDDGWIPPDDLHTLTVPEVSKSLRYIGMKDRVVIRFAQEQIDGNMLCSLDNRLLHEGFPELNMLEVKKIVDFLNGWRPKK